MPPTKNIAVSFKFCLKSGSTYIMAAIIKLEEPLFPAKARIMLYFLVIPYPERLSRGEKQ